MAATPDDPIQAELERSLRDLVRAVIRAVDAYNAAPPEIRRIITSDVD